MRETASIQDRVPIRRVVAVVKSAGGTLIPDNAQEKPMEGEVVAVGDGARDANGKLHPLDVKTGDRVLFGKWAGSEIKLDGRQGYARPEGPQRLLAKSCGAPRITKDGMTVAKEIELTDRFERPDGARGPSRTSDQAELPRRRSRRTSPKRWRSPACDPKESSASERSPPGQIGRIQTEW